VGMWAEISTEVASFTVMPASMVVGDITAEAVSTAEVDSMVAVVSTAGVGDDSARNQVSDGRQVHSAGRFLLPRFPLGVLYRFPYFLLE